MTKGMKYEEAMARLEDIVKRMESGDMDIDSLCQELKTAKELISLCREKLLQTDTQIKEILDEK